LGNILLKNGFLQEYAAAAQDCLFKYTGMGIEKDYLMRQLMMLFEVIYKIIGLRKKGKIGEAEEQISYFYHCLKIDRKFSELSIEELIPYLENEKKLTNEQIELVAYVLKEQGEMAQDACTQRDFLSKAYFLLDKVERESLSFSMDRRMKLTELKESIKD